MPDADLGVADDDSYECGYYGVYRLLFRTGASPAARMSQQSPAQPSTPEIVLEDNHMLVVAKPAGMPSQPDITGDESLVDWASTYLRTQYNKPGDAFVGLAHRLDRPVSGLVLLARTSKALARLNEAIRDRQVDKRYLACVDRRPPDDSGVLVDYLLKDGASNTSRRVSPAHKRGQRAELAYRLLGPAPDGIQGWLVEVELRTGRHHQIRVQLSAMGCPIIGDVKYGSRTTAEPGRILLHAYRLGFEHPVRKTSVALEHWPKWGKS